MASCKKDCLHYGVCCAVKAVGENQKSAEHCISFKNKADFVEVKHGYWIGKPIAGYARIKCSVCRTSFAQ